MNFGCLPAYIDPGSATLALQAILAGAVGSALCLRGWLARMIGVLLRRRRVDPDARNQA